MHQYRSEKRGMKVKGDKRKEKKRKQNEKKRKKKPCHFWCERSRLLTHKLQIKINLAIKVFHV